MLTHQTVFNFQKGKVLALYKLLFFREKKNKWKSINLLLCIEHYFTTNISYYS